MDPLIGKTISDISVFLSQRGYGWLTAKRDLARNVKSLDEQKEIYEEIINRLIEEENQAKDYALHYKALYEEVNITDEDIKYLRQTIVRTFNVIANLTENENNNFKEEDFNKTLELINVDTIKTMQLLGYNYKEAIGKPLTDVTASFIYRRLGDSTKNIE